MLAILILIGVGVLAGVLTGFNRDGASPTGYLQTCGTYAFPKPFGLFSPPLAVQSGAVALSIGKGLVVSS